MAESSVVGGVKSGKTKTVVLNISIERHTGEKDHAGRPKKELIERGKPITLPADEADALIARHGGDEAKA